MIDINIFHTILKYLLDGKMWNVLIFLKIMKWQNTGKYFYDIRQISHKIYHENNENVKNNYVDKIKYIISLTRTCENIIFLRCD